MTENNSAQPPFGALAEEVDESLHPLLKWVVDHVKIILGIVAVLIVAVGGYALYDVIHASHLSKGRDQLAAIAAKPDPAERATELEALSKDAPGAMKNAVLLELADSLSQAGQHEKAAQIWNTLASEDTAGMNVIASLGRASELSRAGKHADAVTTLKALQTKAPESYKALILNRLAYEYELAGDLKGAIQAWQDLSQDNQSSDNAFIESKIASLRSKLDPSS